MSFGLVKHNNNSISAITSAGQLAQGRMTLLQTQTASSSASISFTSNIDSTLPLFHVCGTRRCISPWLACRF